MILKQERIICKDTVRSKEAVIPLLDDLVLIQIVNDAKLILVSVINLMYWTFCQREYQHQYQHFIVKNIILK